MSSVVPKYLVCWLSGQLVIRQAFLKFQESTSLPVLLDHVHVGPCLPCSVRWLPTVSEPSFLICGVQSEVRASSLLQSFVSICTAKFIHNSVHVGGLPNSQGYARIFQSLSRSLYSPDFPFKYFITLLFAPTYIAALGGYDVKLFLLTTASRKKLFAVGKI